MLLHDYCDTEDLSREQVRVPRNAVIITETRLAVNRSVSYHDQEGGH